MTNLQATITGYIAIASAFALAGYILIEAFALVH
jgi:hypothetical protein